MAAGLRLTMTTRCLLDSLKKQRGSTRKTGTYRSPAFTPLCQFCVTESGDWIRPHVDADYRLADATKLTGIIQLVPRSDFEGGTLTIAENEPYDLDIGDAVFFPAHTLHTVAPLTSAPESCWQPGCRGLLSSEPVEAPSHVASGLLASTTPGCILNRNEAKLVLAVASSGAGDNRHSRTHHRGRRPWFGMQSKRRQG